MLWYGVILQRAAGALPHYFQTAGSAAAPACLCSPPSHGTQFYHANPATLSMFRESGVPCAAHFPADSPRPVRAGAKSLVPRPPQGKEGYCFLVSRQRAVRQHLPDAVWHPALPPCQCSVIEQSRVAVSGSGCRGTGAEPRPVFGYFWAGQKYRPAQRSQRAASCVRQVYLSRAWCVRQPTQKPPFVQRTIALNEQPLQFR